MRHDDQPSFPTDTDARVIDTRTMPLHVEEVFVERHRVSTGVVKVATETTVRDHVVEEPLEHETIDVERVAVGRIVETAPDIRQEGNVTIVPVMEEVLVIERRLVLKEEVRIRRVRTTHVHRESVQVREQTAQITRTPAGVASSGVAPTVATPATIS